MSVKGRASKSLTPAQRKILNLLPLEDRPRALKRIRGREWIAARRQVDPEKYRIAVRASNKRAVKLGAYKVGGSRYYGTKSSPKRLAYFKRYNATRRKELAKEVGL